MKFNFFFCLFVDVLGVFMAHKDVDVNAVNRDGVSALSVAAYNDKLKACECMFMHPKTGKDIHIRTKYENQNSLRMLGKRFSKFECVIIRVLFFCVFIHYF